MSRTKKIVAEICMYGGWNRNCVDLGHGWLAQLADGTMLGTGEPTTNFTGTDSLFAACRAIHDAGVKSGRVRVYMPNGTRMAETDLNHPGYYGELKWVPAVQYVISADELIAAASKV